MWNENPPALPGGGVATLWSVQEFMQELLRSDPYGTGGVVPYADIGHRGGGGKVVAITQRQMAFNVANVLMGNDIQGGTGLGDALRNCGSHVISLSLLSFLAVMSQELSGGRHGTMLIAASPRHLGSAVWQERLNNSILKRPEIIVKVPGHIRWDDAPDFMAGGNAFQALTDIAGGVIGGGGNLCNLANTQDESLVQFYTEVLAFAFYSRAWCRYPRSSLAPGGTCSRLRGRLVKVHPTTQCVAASHTKTGSTSASLRRLRKHDLLVTRCLSQLARLRLCSPA